MVAYLENGHGAQDAERHLEESAAEHKDNGELLLGGQAGLPHHLQYFVSLRSNGQVDAGCLTGTGIAIR